MTEIQGDIRTIFTENYLLLSDELTSLLNSITDLGEKLSPVLLPDELDFPLPEFDSDGGFCRVDLSLTVAVEFVRVFKKLVDDLGARFDESRVLPAPKFKIGD